MTLRRSRSLVGALFALLCLAAGAAAPRTGSTPIPRGQEIAYQPVSIPGPWVQGMAKELTGYVFTYPSAYPGQLRALLTRTTDGKMAIAWEGDAAPPGPADEMVHFVWHAG